MALAEIEAAGRSAAAALAAGRSLHEARTAFRQPLRVDAKAPPPTRAGEAHSTWLVPQQRAFGFRRERTSPVGAKCLRSSQKAWLFPEEIGLRAVRQPAPPSMRPPGLAPLQMNQIEDQGPPSRSPSPAGRRSPRPGGLH
eukprot:Transcript_8322.p3 GENE.Transcript_8322~~Transcript_8322.p3  ORF type:complete len:140 (+),score=10.31 Transcript_8322:790-1209(+)